MEKSMIIAVDFDGTCVTHEYPRIGRDIGAVPVLRRLVEAGHKLILYTMRSYMPGISPVTKNMEDGGLEAAVKWFKQHDIPLYGVNENPGQKSWTNSPKVYAQLYIDDAALGCPLMNIEGERPYVDWGKVELTLEAHGVLPSLLRFKSPGRERQPFTPEEAMMRTYDMIIGRAQHEIDQLSGIPRAIMGLPGKPEEPGHNPG